MPNRKLVLSTTPLPPSARQLFRKAGFRLETASFQPKSKAFLKKIKKADGLLTLLTDKVEASFLEKLPSLRAVGNIAIGVDNIDLKYCKANGIQVVNTPDVLTRSVAELTLGLLLATARRFYEGEKLCRSGSFKGWKPDLLLGTDLKGRQAILVGQGRIGKETARLFRAIGLKTEFIRRTDSARTIATKLKRAEVLSLHLPLRPENHHWLSRQRIGLLPRNSIVLNTSRGPLVDEDALIKALEKKRIFGAGLDVFEFEPRIPARLRRTPNTVLLPHIGSATVETRTKMAELAAFGLIEVLSGRKPKNLVKT